MRDKSDLKTQVLLCFGITFVSLDAYMYCCCILISELVHCPCKRKSFQAAWCFHQEIRCIIYHNEFQNKAIDAAFTPSMFRAVFSNSTSLPPLVQFICPAETDVCLQLCWHSIKRNENANFFPPLQEKKVL